MVFRIKKIANFLNKMLRECFLLDGDTVTPEKIFELGQNAQIEVDLTPEAWGRVERARAVVDRVLARREVLCTSTSL